MNEDRRPTDPTLTDDERERQPARDQEDLPPEDGIRSDHAGSGAGTAGPAPAGGGAGGSPEGPAAAAADRPDTPDGAGDATAPGPQTDWLRDAPGGGAAS